MNNNSKNSVEKSEYRRSIVRSLDTKKSTNKSAIYAQSQSQCTSDVIDRLQQLCISLKNELQLIPHLFGDEIHYKFNQASEEITCNCTFYSNFTINIIFKCHSKNYPSQVLCFCVL